MAYRWGAASIVGAATLMCLCVSPAAAHDVVIHANPGDGSVVDLFPHHIELEFSGIPQPHFNRIAISNADSGEVLYSTTPDLDQQFLKVDIPAEINPGPGHYMVGFQITSSDGHATRGKTTFEVAAASHKASTSAASEQSHSSDVADTPSGDSARNDTAQPQKSSWISGHSLLIACGCVVAIGAVLVLLRTLTTKKRKDT